ncbi:DUF5709 domain-containing protein [Pseudonocardia halophobica]|uniref:DUF5709 domain-containing protein n=1 Tax=Pseudonocardia halophobica TaxID=29401 RepID=A0A9W6NX99_9PSEU|nr:DUF5709 domain-containing protein [Pseudonocardia halophobica]GLL12508.1 hypothetical protein GCM10017577_36490 [Pseudonocardia halophobica]
MSRDDNGPDVDTDQLEPEDTLDYRGVEDVLDEGYSPPERPWAVDDYGITPSDEHTGEDLDHRLAREVPDNWGDDDEDADWQSDTSDTDGELRDDQVGDPRAGRLVDAAEGGVSDTDADAWARDVGIDGAGASAEEAAVHVVDDQQ